jgi:hypothetical protein
MAHASRDDAHGRQVFGLPGGRCSTDERRGAGRRAFPGLPSGLMRRTFLVTAAGQSRVSTGFPLATPAASG